MKKLILISSLLFLTGANNRCTLSSPEEFNTRTEKSLSFAKEECKNSGGFWSTKYNKYGFIEDSTCYPPNSKLFMREQE